MNVTSGFLAWEILSGFTICRIQHNAQRGQRYEHNQRDRSYHDSPPPPDSSKILQELLHDSNSRASHLPSDNNSVTFVREPVATALPTLPDDVGASRTTQGFRSAMRPSLRLRLITNPQFLS